MMPLIERVNYKAPEVIYILNQPTEFGDELKQMEAVAPVKNCIENSDEIRFILVFVKSKAEIDESFLQLKDMLKGDAILWYAFPKKSSKKYRVEINRDKGWESLTQAGFAGVRAVAIDSDWSALRFRRVEYIKLMTRTFNPK